MPELVEGIRIIHDDDSIVVIDKPVGVAVHPSPGLDRARPWSATWPAPASASPPAAPRERQGIVQRLDVGTSGRDGDLQVRARLLACSRTPSGTARSTRPTTRSSRAIPIRSRAPSTPRSAATQADYKFAVMADGRHSVTHYETLEAHRFASLLEVHLETGRTHQIRVHMGALKHPCVGDLTYGADPTLAGGSGWSGSGCTP